ncbi:MAG: Ig-like domain-containing protein, partial [candidate division WOR-3 bacterium]
FMASSATDTIPPRITSIRPNLGATNVAKQILIEFVFSEPMDTASTVKFLTTPLDTSFVRWQWGSDWQTLSFGYRETLAPNATVYFALLPTLKDLENNQIKNYGYTFFTVDSSLAPILVSGDLSYNQQPYVDGVVIFSNPSSKAFTLSDKNGKFSIRLDSLVYQILAVADTNFDNQVDLFSELPNFNPRQTQQLKLNLLPDTAKRNIYQNLY